MENYQQYHYLSDDYVFGYFAYSFSKSQNPDVVFLIKGEMIADLQDAGKSPDEKQRFTLRRIILTIQLLIILFQNLYYGYILIKMYQASLLY